MNPIKSTVEANDIIEVFNLCFSEVYSTRLCGGSNEPFYEVHSDDSAVIYFREDFVASALHEVAHWCLAGKQRREQNDYGYWYIGSRDAAAQRQFEAVEVRPQALEWLFTMVLGLPFRVSADNLHLENYDNLPFRQNVRDAAESMLMNGIGYRAMRFALELNTLVGKPKSWCDLVKQLDVTEVPN